MQSWGKSFLLWFVQSFLLHSRMTLVKICLLKELKRIIVIFLSQRIKYLKLHLWSMPWFGHCTMWSCIKRQHYIFLQCCNYYSWVKMRCLKAVYCTELREGINEEKSRENPALWGLNENTYMKICSPFPFLINLGQYAFDPWLFSF